MRFLDLQGGGGSSIKRRAPPPPLFKSGCSVYRRPGVTAVVENSCGSGCTPSRFSGLLRWRPSMEVFSEILSNFPEASQRSQNVHSHGDKQSPRIMRSQSYVSLDLFLSSFFGMLTSSVFFYWNSLCLPVVSWQIHYLSLRLFKMLAPK
ncbi:unnamed protein product [Brassica napus]|uniref:(rape) hypothetical protein n=1 Tax=Brassica napus TaxID=3708 RepID=A0A816P342_BRANA|nr:unnamed protein product [Brassica napus]